MIPLMILRGRLFRAEDQDQEQDQEQEYAKKQQRPMEKIRLSDKFGSFTEHWRPKIVGELNGQEVKVVKFKGEFLWHHHEKEDEMFLVWRGRMRVEFRDHAIELEPGEFLIVPHGIEHRTVADEEVEVVLFEPAETKNTGNRSDDRFTAPSGIRI